MQVANPSLSHDNQKCLQTLPNVHGVETAPRVNRCCKGVEVRMSLVCPQSREKVKVTRSSLALWNPMDYSPPGSSVHGILQARIFKQVAISFSRGIFPTQVSNPGLLHCRLILYHLNHKGSQRETFQSHKINTHTVELPREVKEMDGIS